MSREHSPVGLAVEWSPRGVVAYDAATRQTRTAEDLSELGLRGREAVLALSRRGVFVRTARVPNASPAEIRTILTIQAGELFPLPIIDLAWDFALTDDINGEGRLAVLAAVPSADLRRVMEAAAAANLKVRAAVPLAVGATLIAQELGLAEAAFVESADDGPAVDVVSGGSLRASRATPASVPLETEVARALGIAGMENAPVVGAGGSNIPSAAYHTDRTALMALADTNFDRLKLRLELPEAVAARSAASVRGANRVALLTLAVGFLLAALVGMDWYDTGGTVAQARKTAQIKLTKIQGEQKKLGATHQTAVDRQDMIDHAFFPAQRVSEVVAVATTNVPKGGAWLKSFTVERGKAMTLRGTAKTEAVVASLVQHLDTGTGGRFRAVDLTNANNTLVNKIPVTEFVVTAFPVGNLPILTRPGAK